MAGKYLPTVEPGELTPEDPATITRPWDRLPNEPAGYYVYYQAYQEQGYRDGYTGKLTVRSVSELEREARLTLGSLSQAYTVYQWEQRAGAWDREVSRRMDAISQDDSQALRARQMRLARKMRNLGEVEIDKLISRAHASPTEPTLTPKEAIMFAEWGAKLERGLTDGASTPADRAGNGVVNLENLETPELERLQKLITKASGRGSKSDAPQD